MPHEYLQRFSELHHVLQAMRQRVRFPRAPGSLRVFRAQVPDEVQHRFDYRDIRLAPFLASAYRADGVIASLLDWGAMSDGITAPTFEAAEQVELHPSQFPEVAAFGAYTATKFNREFAYLVSHAADHDVLEPIIVKEAGADPNSAGFDPFEPKEMARVLAEFTGFELEDVYDAEKDSVWANLATTTARPRTSPSSGCHWAPSSSRRCGGHAVTRTASFSTLGPRARGSPARCRNRVFLRSLPVPWLRARQSVLIEAYRQQRDR